PGRPRARAALARARRRTLRAARPRARRRPAAPAPSGAGGLRRALRPRPRRDRPQSSRRRGRNTARCVYRTSGGPGLAASHDYTAPMPGSTRIIPLGGLGEIGKNTTVFEADGEAIVIDA